ncbi:unnamed protein product [Protopolystoma xenopodis]|uniref:Uncharacterized protein n=1 Tax=Protopolystoma xenopodis TaxID=117903 RepID=A0A3S5CD20_9PLAT|nr:unnamed protein product [Protopolystoma xenopodis]
MPPRNPPTAAPGGGPGSSSNSSTMRIRLSEYRERVLDSRTGQTIDVAADTFLLMDYSTGQCEKIKCYRQESPDVLNLLPVQTTHSN